MNDGVARMSRKVAERIRALLGLSTIPSAVQGRLGSAKGMWIVDVNDSSDELWIETYPSQRKWDLDWIHADEDHLTLEIRKYASMPKSASFNLQFLPVLENRAIDRPKMRRAVGELLRDNLQQELNGQKRALQSSMQYRQWTHENASHKQDRMIHGHIPYLGGMPQEDEELMNCMLDAGFDPRSNAFLKKIAYEMQRRKCQALTKKLNTKVGRSAYLYMVMDFWGVLEENEVHVGFSTAFEADDAWSKTMIHGTDVLVARSPAHFISDIQRVKAVFKPELADLTDVIVFSSKGNVPLADKLSGGDYDGDLAWVCWDFRIVENFQNAAVEKQPDLSHFMPKDKETFSNILLQTKKPDGKASLGNAVSGMMQKSFAFNLTKSMLGACTNYKERLCYQNNTVGDDTARLLSTLLSNLVDQAKQGVQFTAEDFEHLKQHYKLPLRVNEPHYKSDTWVRGNQGKTHIIDYLKFDIAQPTIAEELKSFNAALEAHGNPSHYDEDLDKFYKQYSGQQSKSMDRLLTHLRNDIKYLATQWDSFSSKKDGDEGFKERMCNLYAQWQNIQPKEQSLDGRNNNKTVYRLILGGEMSHWALLKASTVFWMFCNGVNREKYGFKPRFVWQMAYRQLCYLKAMAVTERGLTGAAGSPTVVLPHMYAALRPDSRFIKQRVARLEGQGSHFSQELDHEIDMDEDD